ncbi:hypothetical protein Btru_031327 [Bulinus truncatus]|nr:hypothetical protein Btru_031327 [Bulinus truncatus]
MTGPGSILYPGTEILLAGRVDTARFKNKLKCPRYTVSPCDFPLSEKAEKSLVIRSLVPLERVKYVDYLQDDNNGYHWAYYHTIDVQVFENFGVLQGFLSFPLLLAQSWPKDEIKQHNQSSICVNTKISFYIVLLGESHFAMGLLALICLLTQCIALAEACKIKACYYNNYATLRPSHYKVFPEMLNPHLCTHMIYAFAHIANNKLIAAYPMDEDSPWKTGLYTRFNNLKKNNTSLLTLLSVGGWDFGVKEFIQMASTPQNRKTFIDHAIVFLRDRNFDGLDLRWEHPTGRGGTYRDKTNYSLLIKELKAAFVKESELTKKRTLMLTAALTGDLYGYMDIYEVDKISNVAPPVPGDEPVKVIMPYKNPYPFPPYAPRSFHLLTKDELNEKCKNTTGEVKLPYEGIDCWAHILCVNGVGSMDNCPYLQRLDLDICQIKACYYSNDAALRPPRYAVFPERLNPHLCTHMIYAFAHIANNKLSPAIPWDEDSPWTAGLYTRFNNLKKNNTSLLTLLSVGGWDFGVKEFIQMTSTQQNRKTFIDHAIKFFAFVILMALTCDGSIRQELKAAFVKESEITKKRTLMVTAALTGDLIRYREIYEVDKISKPPPTYPYLGSSFAYVFHIHATGSESIHISKGVPKNKLVVGIPMYSQSYYSTGNLAKIKYSFEETDPSYGVGKPGIFSYFEICQMIEHGWYVGRTNGSPYLHLTKMWAGYDDAESIREKVRYVKKNGYAGVMFWSLDLDDVNRQWCKKFPQNLLESADEECRSSAPLSSVDPFVLGEEPVKILMPYTSPYPTPSRPPIDFEFLTQDELNEQCQNTAGEVKIPYPVIYCIAYINCVGGIAPCGQVNLNTPGVIDSSKLADNIKSITCQWNIYAPKRNTINVSFLSFCLSEEDYGCFSVFINVNPISSESSRFCGCKTIPADIQSTGNYLKILFTSDRGMKGNQFVLSYRFESPCGERNLRTAPGIIRSAGYRDIDLDPFPCQWNISAPVAKRISLSIDSVTESGKLDSCDIEVFKVSNDFHNWTEISHCTLYIITKGNPLSVIHVPKSGKRIEFSATYVFEAYDIDYETTSNYTLISSTVWSSTNRPEISIKPPDDSNTTVLSSTNRPEISIKPPDDNNTTVSSFTTSNNPEITSQTGTTTTSGAITEPYSCVAADDVIAIINVIASCNAAKTNDDFGRDPQTT